MSLHELTPSSRNLEYTWDDSMQNHDSAGQSQSLVAVEVQSSERQPNGMVVRRVMVEDESQLPVFSESERLERLRIRHQLEVWDRRLQEQPDARPPEFDKDNQAVVSHNEASAYLFDHDVDIREWGLLMPSARALYYLTHLDTPTLPSGRPISDKMRNFMTEMVDAIGIRTRKRIAADRVRSILDEAPTDETAQCLSLACGAADLMLETVAASNQSATLSLVDIDPSSLAMADNIAEELSLTKDADYTLLTRNLITDMVRSDDLVKEVGEDSQTVVDALGINEYFSVPIAKEFLKNAYRCVKPGGSLITSNMLDDRPQMHINKLVVGWPKVIPRSIDDIGHMLEAAGLPLDHAEITVPEDGVYAVVEIKKPASGA